MIETILKNYQESNFNFKDYANPNDSLHYLFDEWVDYYQLKWAIAKTIQPQSILEIGVRYGYSAIAFLEACPCCEYTGIDINNSEFGGAIDAIEWAKKITKAYKANFYMTNTQTMLTFPGELYDLIHVDGQQDGDGTYHDLEKAIKQGKYILVDGFFWTPENFQASSAFLKDNKELIEYYFVIPGYAGELLIKSKLDKKLQNITKLTKSKDIKNTYQDLYYLNDCGGFHEYKITSGKELSDRRLRAVFQLADVKKGEHIIDAGCGRGELTYACATVGASVDAIDYSNDAIALAKKCFTDEHIIKQVNFHCLDITKFVPEKEVNKVIASDIIEHLSSEEVEILYKNVSEFLTENGRFVIHTFPNLWFYKYGYIAKRNKAKRIGCYLSPEPRSYFERLMHINEQSPRVLQKQLKKYFKYVLLWFGTPENPLDSLVRKFGKSDCMNTRDLFAIASNVPIDIHEIKSKFFQYPLTIEQRREISFELNHNVVTALVNEMFTVEVILVNKSGMSISSNNPNPIHIAYHWLDENHNMLVFDGNRTVIPYLSKDNQKPTIVKAKIKAPNNTGTYILQIDLVQEMVAWFENTNIDHLKEIKVKVS